MSECIFLISRRGFLPPPFFGAIPPPPIPCAGGGVHQEQIFRAGPLNTWLQEKTEWGGGDWLYCTAFLFSWVFLRVQKTWWGPSVQPAESKDVHSPSRKWAKIRDEEVLEVDGTCCNYVSDYQRTSLWCYVLAPEEGQITLKRNSDKHEVRAMKR